MSPEKKQLINLEKSGDFVFHGTDKNVDLFEPHQAHNFYRGIQEKDGPPAVFASSAADYAIFMAIINETNCPKGYGSGAGTSSKSKHPQRLSFRASRDALEQLQESASGWVYVFDRGSFKQRDKGGVEYVSHEAIKPLERIKVSKKDLPPDIEVFERK